MIDAVPIRAWLLLMTGAIAFAPARYVVRHVAHSKASREVAAPPADAPWRTSSLLARNLFALLVLIGFAIFIYTPQAAAFARSPAFWPILTGACGLWSLYSAAKGIMTGSVQPLARGFDDTYDRTAQPNRFWLSVAWNAIFGLLCVWIAFGMIDQETEDRCYDTDVVHTPQEALAACKQLILERGEDGETAADLISARGFAYHRMDDLDRALIDYNAAIYLDPSDSYALYNRALIYHQLRSARKAIRDYSASLRIRPNNYGALINRGLLYLGFNATGDARTDFEHALDLRPGNVSARAYRGLSFAMEGNRSRAIEDFKVVQTADPDNQAVRKGLETLNMRADEL